MLKSDFVGRVALVTGGGTGLGRVVSQSLARSNAVVAISYGHSEAEARETEGLITAAGGAAGAFLEDLEGKGACDRLVESVVDRFGRLDILVHNAATTVRVPYMDLDGLREEDWDRVMALNVKVPWLLTRAAAPHLAESGHGTVVMVSSVAAFEPSGSLVYSVSKAALRNLASVLSRVLAPAVRVNAVAPGLMHTRWTAHFPDEAVKGYCDRSLLQRTVTLEDTADAVILLAANQSITGETIVVDSGVALRH